MLAGLFKSSKLLGLNARNLNVIMKHNPRALYPRADSKIIAKRLAIRARVPVPPLLGLFSSLRDFRRNGEAIIEQGSFVVKPEHGAGGRGVLVIDRGEKNELVTPGGRSIQLRDVHQYIADILSGLHSLGGHPDRAMLEYRVIPDPAFLDLVSTGVPDVRLIVYQGIPVMAMLRLPTLKSRGRANLHQGAIGLGIDLKHGKTTYAIQGTRSIEKHPDNDAILGGWQIPYWDQMLRIAALSYQVFGLGYFGVDVVVDKHSGPLLLEANVRPGLAIQLANRQGLAERIRVTDRLRHNLRKIEERVSFSQTTFS